MINSGKCDSTLGMRIIHTLSHIKTILNLSSARTEL